MQSSTVRQSTVLPRTEEEVTEAAMALEIAIPGACLPGVIATLAVLDVHAETLLGNQFHAGQ